MDEAAFRIVIAAAVLLMLAIAGIYHRGLRPAQRRMPDPLVELLRWMLIGPAAVGVLIYLIEPGWMAWSRLPLPEWLRWGGVVLLGVCIAGIWWAFHTLGVNFAATLLIRREHRLVTSGPYRLVRHPMYTLGVATFVALFLVTASWFIGAFGAAGMAVLMIARVPKEEAMLREEFGEIWDRYAAQTGRFLPRPPRNR